MVLFGAIDNSATATLLNFTPVAPPRDLLRYTVRFLTVAYMPALSGIERTCGSLHEVSQTLGQTAGAA